MYVILFELDTIPFYAKIDVDCYHFVCDPRKATPFKKNDAKQWLKKQSNFQSIAKIVVQSKVIVEFKKSLEKGLIYRTFPLYDEKWNVPYDHEKHSREFVLDFYCFHGQNQLAVAYETYATYPPLYDLFECIHSVITYPNEQISFQFKIQPDTKFETFQAELDLIRDRITRLEKDGSKKIAVFDRHLSEGGDVANFTINADGTYDFDAIDCDAEDADLFKVFQLWQKFRYYE